MSGQRVSNGTSLRSARATDELAGQFIGALVMVDCLRPTHEGAYVAFAALNEPPDTSGEIVELLGTHEAQAIQVDHVAIGLHPRRQYASITETVES